MVKIEVGVHYRLLNLEAGTYITLDRKDDVSIICQKHIDKSSQVFMFEASGRDNAYLIKSVETNQYVAVPNRYIVEGQQLKTNVAPFEWCVVDEPHMAIAARLRPSTNANLYADLRDGNPKDGTPVQLYPKKGNNQVFVLLKEQCQ